MTEECAVGPLRFPFTRIADPNRVLDEVAAEADRLERVSGRREAEPLHLPYWAELWDSATGLGQLLAARRANRPPAAPPAVLDLGCGMGLSGTVAAALGGRVLFADLEPPALLFARLNALPFGSPARPIRARRLNWQTDRLGERFDLILGADILYERKQWDFLEPFWRIHLAPGGCALLGEPGRPTGDDFAAWITQRGWGVTVHEESVTTRPRPIRIFQIEPHG